MVVPERMAKIGRGKGCLELRSSRFSILKIATQDRLLRGRQSQLVEASNRDRAKAPVP